MKTFPFGNQITAVRQEKRCRKKVFVLGVYASAVHARWIDENGKTRIRAMAVASEPSIFWDGSGVESIIKKISIPPKAGKLVPASKSLNGPSGKALDDFILKPLGVDREQAWLCDLLPESRCNLNQMSALDDKYRPLIKTHGLPEYNFPPVPKVLATKERVDEISNEILEATPDVLITLGDKPLQWYTSHFGSEKLLSAYGKGIENYGELHNISIAGFNLALLPLVHVRQAGRLGNHSKDWAELHDLWIQTKAEALLF